MAAKPLEDTWRRRLELAMDLGERTFSVLLFAGMVVRITLSPAFHLWDALVLLSEGLVVAFIVFRRLAVNVSSRPMDWLVALVGTGAPMLVRVGGHAVGPPAVAVFLMTGGLLFSIWAKLILRRSFGLAAANRGVVDAGPYGFVRHPIYAGYIVVYIGFLLANPTAWNAGVYALTVGLLIIRILAEERVLKLDIAYSALMSRVRYRLAPGVF